MTARRVTVACALGLGLAACGALPASNSPAPTANPGSPSPRVAALTISSPELNSGKFPRSATCDSGGIGRAPVIQWSGADPATRAIAVEMIDLDVAGSGFAHWLAFTDDGLSSGSINAANTTAFHMGANDFGSQGYGGPCPPPGETHHYRITLTALTSALGRSLPAGYTRAQLDATLANLGSAVVNQGSLVATYQRQG